MSAYYFMQTLLFINISSLHYEDEYLSSCVYALDNDNIMQGLETPHPGFESFGYGRCRKVGGGGIGVD